MCRSSSVYQCKGYRPLSSLSIGILGIGDIGHRIAEVCNTLGMTVWGVSRTQVPEEKAVLINVGRGSLLSDKTIIEAIRKGWILGAILDVFEVEPLPPDSELWKMPEVIVTPHSSALASQLR
ncbi:hypothetical protein EMCRGX_G032807 [Ephydatia muelleri]